MTTIFKSAGAVSAATDRAPRKSAEPLPVRSPPLCTECDGNGTVRGYGTNDPSEPLGAAECDKCGGTGEGPCGPACSCWCPETIVYWPGEWGTCTKDDDDEDHRYFQAGELAMWREKLL